MPGMGPAPKPNARYKHPGRAMQTQAARLPQTGRQGDPPAWPLDRQSKREAVLWARLWRTPQAVAWESLGWVDVVARYARVLTQAERRAAPATALAEARQFEDRLGLTPLALLRLRWAIVDDEDAGETAPEVLDIRERLQASG